jgi:hypothetical protein
LDHTAIDRTDQIRADAEALRQLAAHMPEVVFVNNHFAGYPVQATDSSDGHTNPINTPFQRTT